MIDYGLINKNRMYGTMLYCIENFPEDFGMNHLGNLAEATELGSHDGIQIIYALDKNPSVFKPSFYGFIIEEPCVTHRLLRENFFDPNVTIHHDNLFSAFKFYVMFGSKFPKKRNRYLKMYIRRILKPRININTETLDKYYSQMPKELQEYFFRTLFYSDNMEQTIVVISKFFRDYNTLTYFFRHCKPKLEWNKLIHSISEDTFYRIISITNRMKCYKNILHSYEEMKQLHKRVIPEKVYSKFIQDYLKAYTDNSMMSQIIKPQVHRIEFDWGNNYRVRRPDGAILSPRA